VENYVDSFPEFEGVEHTLGKAFFRPFQLYITCPKLLNFQSLKQDKKFAIVWRLQIGLMKITATNFGCVLFSNSFLLVKGLCMDVIYAWEFGQPQPLD